MKDRIYQLMKQKGMSQKEFANELCIAEGTLSSVFSGRTKPSNNIVYSIHECFPEISIPWLMFGEGEMTAQVVAPASDADNAPSSSLVQPAQDLFQPAPSPAVSYAQMAEMVKSMERPQRKITEIRVFFDDGTFQTFAG